MANGGESTRIRHLIWKTLVATSCPPTIPIPKAPNSLLLPLFLIQPRSPTYSPSDWFLYSLGDGSQGVTWVCDSFLIPDNPSWESRINIKIQASPGPSTTALADVLVFNSWIVFYFVNIPHSSVWNKPHSFLVVSSFRLLHVKLIWGWDMLRPGSCINRSCSSVGIGMSLWVWAYNLILPTRKPEFC